MELPITAELVLNSTTSHSLTTLAGERLDRVEEHLAAT